MRSRRHGDPSSEEHGIDLAPMLDFVLNLLIFFIITTSFVREAGVTVNRPEALTASHDDSGNILIAIRPNGEIWMDRRQVDLREVRPLVERLHAQKPDWGVMVTAEQNAEAGLLVLVVDQVREGGVQNVSFGTSSR